MTVNAEDLRKGITGLNIAKERLIEIEVEFRDSADARGRDVSVALGYVDAALLWLDNLVESF